MAFSNLLIWVAFTWSLGPIFPMWVVLSINSAVSTAMCFPKGSFLANTFDSPTLTLPSGIESRSLSRAVRYAFSWIRSSARTPPSICHLFVKCWSFSSWIVVGSNPKSDRLFNIRWTVFRLRSVFSQISSMVKPIEVVWRSLANWTKSRSFP